MNLRLIAEYMNIINIYILIVIVMYKL